MSAGTALVQQPQKGQETKAGTSIIDDKAGVPTYRKRRNWKAAGSLKLDSPSMDGASRSMIFVAAGGWKKEIVDGFT